MVFHDRCYQLLNSQSATWRLAFLLLLLLYCGIVNTVAAGSISISPIRLDFSNNRPDVAFRLRNEADQAATFQVRAYAWTVQNNQDELDLTKDILVAPAIVKIEPRSEQIVRALYRGQRSVSTESSFRILVSELPSVDPAVSSQIKVLLNLSIPAFVAPVESHNVKPILKAEAQITSVQGAEHLKVTLSNTGSQHFRLDDMSVRAGTMQTVSENALSKNVAEISQTDRIFFSQSLTYLLPGTERSWSFPLPSGRVRSPLSIPVHLRSKGSAIELITPALD